MSKVQGNIVDLLMPPLLDLEIVIAFTLAGITRGVVVAIATAAVMAPFIDFQIYNLGVVIFFSIFASAIMSLVGFISGIWAEKWDHLGTVGNFVIVPLSFLSGTFYSISVLPELIQQISLINPFFYMIDGFRYGFIGASDAPLIFSVIVIFSLFFILLIISYCILKSGYKLRN